MNWLADFYFQLSDLLFLCAQPPVEEQSPHHRITRTTVTLKHKGKVLQCVLFVNLECAHIGVVVAGPYLDLLVSLQWLHSLRAPKKSHPHHLPLGRTELTRGARRSTSTRWVILTIFLIIHYVVCFVT